MFTCNSDLTVLMVIILDLEGFWVQRICAMQVAGLLWQLPQQISCTLRLHEVNKQHVHSTYLQGQLCLGIKVTSGVEIVALNTEVRQLKGNLQLMGKIVKNHWAAVSAGTTNVASINKKQSSKKTQILLDQEWWTSSMSVCFQGWLSFQKAQGLSLVSKSSCVDNP